ncbi:MAG: hypothetical protein COA58_07840 [Bacteroidetes bacterium]|nr:MAG: hypothetical protein COA58_07840 [Bacteroidota bacterium]
MKWFFVFLISGAVLSCSFKSSDNQPIESVESSKYDTLTYPKFLDQVKGNKANYDIVKKRELLFECVHEAIPYYWKGTPWTFTGHTTSPKNGEIACGYYVTNTLHALGFKINRFKLAQEVSAVMIKQLTVNVKHLSSIDELSKYLGKQQTNDAFIIGLDFHTGYVTKEGAEYYFIHSNYIDNQGVVKELLRE